MSIMIIIKKIGVIYKMKLEAFFIVLGLFIIALLVWMMIVFGSQNVGSEVDVSGQSDTTVYSYIMIDGMPCLRRLTVDSSSLTCDWSRWQGTVDGDEIIVKEK